MAGEEVRRHGEQGQDQQQALPGAQDGQERPKMINCYMRFIIEIPGTQEQDQSHPERLQQEGGPLLARWTNCTTLFIMEIPGAQGNA